MSVSIEDLYNFYEIINNNEETAANKKTAYEKILEATNGDEKEKRLASQFISKFLKLYPDLYEQSFNKLLDLSEDDNVNIRKQLIQVLPIVGKDVAQFLPKIVDTLTQMLVSDDQSEIFQLYSSLNYCLKLNSKVTIESTFSQLITQLEEAQDLINTNAFKYLNETLTSEMELSPEIETFIETNSTTLLTKLVGKNEYSLIINILSILKVNSTLLGRQKLVNNISEQIQLLGDIKDMTTLSIVKNYCKETVKLLSKNVHADEVLTYLLNNLTGIIKLVATNENSDLFEIFKYIINFANTGINSETNVQVSSLKFNDEDGLKSLKNLFEICFDNLPSVPEDVTDDYVTQLSVDSKQLSLYEVSLLSMYYLCKYRPESITSEEAKLAEFRKKLQLLARVNQCASEHNDDTLTKMSKKEQKIFKNIQILIREFFKNPISFKVLIIPSWNTHEAVATKRRNDDVINSGPEKVNKGKRQRHNRNRRRMI